MIFQVVLAFCVIVTLGEGNEPISAHPFVQTGKGRLRGNYDTSRNGNQYEAYLGIRYAEVSRRFDMSRPTGSWDGTKDSLNFSLHCSQATIFGSPHTGQEDCLYLNVFTPKADHSKRAVFVFIHGGGFHMGACTEVGADYLMDEDILLVTLSYRVGILGFLNTPRGPIAGNMGLKDQVEALKWIQENIEYFGGDKNRVTISGHSAGGASVLYLMSSPLAQGLFHGVYAMSGAPLNPFGFKRTNLEEIQEIGELLNCNTKDQTDLVTCLRDEPLETLMLAQKSIQKWYLDVFKISPSVELKSTLNPEPFLDEPPEQRLRSGNFTKVPVLITMTKDEGGFAYASLLVRNDDLLKDLNDNYERVAPITFMLKEEFGQKSKEVVGAMKEFYFDTKVITPDMEDKLTEAYSDTWFTLGITRTAHLLATYTKVYTGLFTHSRRDFSPVQIFGIDDDIEGVVHGEDLSYLFNPTGVPNPIPQLSAFTEVKDIEFSKKYVHLIASFVKEGVPKLPFEEGSDWSPVSQIEVDTKTLNWMEITEKPTAQINPFEHRLNFWNTQMERIKTGSGTPKHDYKERTEL